MVHHPHTKNVIYFFPIGQVSADGESVKVVVKTLKRSTQVVKDKYGQEKTVEVEEEVEEEVWMPANRDYSEFVILPKRGEIVLDHTYDDKYNNPQAAADPKKNKGPSAKELALQALLAAEAEAAELKSLEEKKAKRAAELAEAEAKALAAAEAEGKKISSLGPSHWREKMKRYNARRIRNNNQCTKLYMRNRVIELNLY